MTYVGRFAPSPTGPLHFGSLVAAVASYLDAKSNNGKWLIRIEDLDKPREVTGATQAIIHCLDAYGFVWDDEIIYQSQQTEYYEKALQQLRLNDLIYPCTCTRKEITDSSTQHGIEGIIYPNTCRQGHIQDDKPIAWRLVTQDNYISFTDTIQGDVTQNLKQDIGDFILKRADGLFAYQLAVVVDDAEQGITHIVRGADLLNSTPRQIYLQQLLGLSTPNYLHIPVVANTLGQKLSKQTLAEKLDSKESVCQLWLSLRFLNQNPPDELKKASLNQVWQWAISHWNVSTIKGTTKMIRNER